MFEWGDLHLNKEQLLAFAEENNIEIPGNMSKEDTIRKHIQEELTAADPE
ncbi:hypothetical protein [Gracilibacillus boraciitolerans]|nr:hypothetical protein [Gracilibacillus boraciitolerans]